MLDAHGSTAYRPDPRLVAALETLLVLHAEHELDCCTAAVRHLASRCVGLEERGPGGRGPCCVCMLSVWYPLHELVLLGLQAKGEINCSSAVVASGFRRAMTVSIASKWPAVSWHQYDGTLNCAALQTCSCAFCLMFAHP
jgi:hypothetical protein